MSIYFYTGEKQHTIEDAVMEDISQRVQQYHEQFVGKCTKHYLFRELNTQLRPLTVLLENQCTVQTYPRIISY